MVETGKPLSELASVMDTYPQVLINVPDVDKSALAGNPDLAELVDQAKAELGENGRVLLRASGTEALVRVMVEAKDQGSAQSWAERIANLVAEKLAL
jgi:phosphoglucosamine mutase